MLKNSSGISLKRCCLKEPGNAHANSKWSTQVGCLLLQAGYIIKFCNKGPWVQFITVPDGQVLQCCFMDNSRLEVWFLLEICSPGLEAGFRSLACFLTASWASRLLDDPAYRD